jgi:hypothetical protein
MQNLVVIALGVAMCIGWFMNLFDVIAAALGSSHVTVTWLEIIGVVIFPLGGVMGWL